MKVNFKLDRDSLRRIERDFAKKSDVLVRKMSEAGGRIITEETKRMVDAGISPVKGKGRFKKYSESYSKQIKRGKVQGKSTRPVNLKVTGKMMKSLEYKKITNGVRILFTDEKALYHNKLGAGKSKVKRRIMPIDEGEEYSRVITSRLTNAFRKLMSIFSRR